jgi:hypothetical protein
MKCMFEMTHPRPMPKGSALDRPATPPQPRPLRLLLDDLRVKRLPAELKVVSRQGTRARTPVRKTTHEPSKRDTDRYVFYPPNLLNRSS